MIRLKRIEIQLDFLCTFLEKPSLKTLREVQKMIKYIVMDSAHRSNSHQVSTRNDFLCEFPKEANVNGLFWLISGFIYS